MMYVVLLLLLVVEDEVCSTARPRWAGVPVARRQVLMSGTGRGAGAPMAGPQDKAFWLLTTVLDSYGLRDMCVAALPEHSGGSGAVGGAD